MLENALFAGPNKAGHPLGVTTAYVPVDGKIWMTATRERVRIKAIARDGRSAVVMSSKGTHMGGGKTVTYKGHTVIHDDPGDQNVDVPAARSRNVQRLRILTMTSRWGWIRDLFVKFLDTPERIVLEFTPEMSIPFDGDKMAKGTGHRLRGICGQGSKRRLNARSKLMSIK